MFKGGSKLQVVSWDVVNGYIKVCYDDAGSEAAVVGIALEVGWISIRNVSGSNRGQPFKALLDEDWYPCNWQCKSHNCTVWVPRGGKTIDDIECEMLLMGMGNMAAAEHRSQICEFAESEW